ncbi:MAG TPA: lysophospholipid acyltransferase family protein [Bryobacteraceae bacterium]|nr:lysophospholipid acyltransferase family protein [Bryobacteraceae bacterium]
MDRITFIQYLIAQFVLWSLAHSPLALARFYTKVLDLAVPRLRRTARRNLELAYPQKTAAEREAFADEVFQSIARLLYAFARFPRLNRQNISEWIRYEGLEHYLEAKRAGRGILVATAHFGNWELSAFAHALMTEPMHIMIRPLDNPAIDRLVEGHRTLSGNRLIAKWDGARAVLRALQQNEAVGILIDQNTSLEEGVFVNFFGTPACANTAFAKIAARTGAAVVPGFAVWSEKEARYVLRFYPPVPMSGDTAEDTQRIHSLLEGVIREHPGQWLWIHRRWKTRPPGEPFLY